MLINIILHTIKDMVVPNAAPVAPHLFAKKMWLFYFE